MMMKKRIIEDIRESGRGKFEDLSYIKKLNNDIALSGVGEALSKSIVSAIKSVLIVGGFVAIFSVIISILKASKILNIFSLIISKTFNLNIDLVKGTITGILEFTNGLSTISKIPAKSLSLKLAISSFLLGFGGISVYLQVASIAFQSKLSSRKYLIAKIFQGLIALSFTLLIFKLPIMNLDLN